MPLEDNKRYKEIGELSIKEGSPMVIGPIKNKNSSWRNKSLLSPDSDRLLYNYSPNALVEDYAIYTPSLSDSDNEEKQIFIGRNILTIYDTNTGNFYIENPRKILNKLMKPIGQGGLNLSGEDLEYVCEHLKYVLAIDSIAYFISTKLNGSNVFFKMNLYTLEIEGVITDQFIEHDINDKMIYCKPITFNKYIYLVVRNSNESKVEVYKYSTVNGELSLEESMTNTVSSFYNEGAINRNSISVLLDTKSEMIYFIGCVNSNSIRPYNYKRGIMSAQNVIQTDLGLLNRTFKQVNLYEDPNSRTSTTYITLLTDNNQLIFITDPNTIEPSESSQFAVTKYSFIQTHGVLGYCKVEIEPGRFGFYILVKKANASISAIYFDQESVSEDKSINVTDELKKSLTPAFIKSLSEKINITQNIFTSDMNLIIGNYEEAGITLPLIKDFGIPRKGIENPAINRLFRTVLDKDSGVSLVKGLSYGDSQMTRVRLFPENILTESAVLPEDRNTVIALRESEDDKFDYKYTTGSYIWNILKNTGMPYNTHVTTLGRIIVDGFDIPIEKTMITKANGENTYGDVLFTFDKLFDISILKDALSEEISQYPGVLFFKNNGFLQNAVISNSYILDGSIFYDDATNGKLFDGVNGIHSIISSCKLDETTILLGTNFGGIASVNIQTGGYCSITGKKSGDNPPPFYKTIDDYNTNGCIVGITRRNNYVFAIFSSGIISIASIDNYIGWTNVYTPSNLSADSDNKYIKKVYEVKDNLLLISMTGGGIFTFDMDSLNAVIPNPIQTVPSTSKDGKVVNAAVSAFESSQVVLGNRIYYMPTSNNELNYAATLCWYDFVTNTFGCIGTTDGIDLNSNNDGGMLVSDGKYIYIISDKRMVSKSFMRYDTTTDTLKSLSPIPNCTSITFTGAYIKDQNVYVPFGIIDGIKYIFEYISDTDTWITHQISNAESIPTVYNSNFFIFKDTAGNSIYRIIFGKNKTGDVASKADLNDSIIDINISLNDVEHAVSSKKIADNSTLYYGTKVYYDDITKRLFVSGGRAYSDTISDTGLLLCDRDFVSKKPQTTKIKNLSYVIGTIKEDSIFEIGGKSELDDDPKTNAYFYDSRKWEWKQIHNIAHYGNTNTDIISAMKVVGDRNILVISYANGAIASIDLRNGDFIPATSPDNRTRCVHTIFAKPGEFSDEGATSINEVGEDVIFNTPSRTFRWSSLIGAFFTRDDEKFLNKFDNSLKASNVANYDSKLFEKPIAGSSKVSVGKYIIFANGYDSEDPTDPTSKINRGIFAYDTQYNDYATLVEGSNTDEPEFDKAINGTVRSKYNAFSIYKNGYIYTFGGLSRISERVPVSVSGSENLTSNKRTGAIERYDLITGNITEMTDKYFGYKTPAGTLYNVDPDDSYTVLTTAGRKETRVLTPFSQSQIFDKSGTNKIFKDRYYMGFVTMGDASEKVITIYTGSKESGYTEEQFNTNALCIFDSYTEEIVNTRGAEFDALYDIAGDDVVIPIERFESPDNVEQYLAVYKSNSIQLIKLTVEGGSYKMALLPESYTYEVTVDKFEANDFRRGICVPFYDDRLDAFVFPDLQVAKIKGTLSVVKQNIVYDFTEGKFDIVKQDTSCLFNIDNGSAKLNRLNPILNFNDELYTFDDILYKLKSQEYGSVTAKVVKTIDKTKLVELFGLGIKDDTYPDISKYTGIVPFEEAYYKGVLIHANDPTYIEPELGNKSKTRFVVLKYDPNLNNVTVENVIYPKGTWSGKTNYICKSFVCDNLVWFIPKLGIVENEVTDKIPNVVFSYSSIDDTIVEHTISGDKIPSKILRTKFVVDDARKNVHILLSGGGTNGSGFNLKDMMITGISQLSHSSASSVELKTITESAVVVSEGFSKVLVNGVITDDGKYHLVLLLTEQSLEQIRDISGELNPDGSMFVEGGNISNKAIVKKIIYSNPAYDRFVDISHISDNDDSVLQTIDSKGNTSYYIYDKSYSFKDEFNVTVNTLFTIFDRNFIVFIKPQSGKSLRMIRYDINDKFILNDYKILKNIVEVKDYTTKDDKRFVFDDFNGSKKAELFKSCSDFAIYYSNKYQALYKYNYKTKIMEKILDLSGNVNKVTFNNFDNKGGSFVIYVPDNTTIGNAIMQAGISGIDNYDIIYKHNGKLVDENTNEPIFNDIEIDCTYSIMTIDVTVINMDNNGNSEIITVNRKSTLGSVIKDLNYSVDGYTFDKYTLEDGTIVTETTETELLNDIAIRCNWIMIDHMILNMTTEAHPEPFSIISNGVDNRSELDNTITEISTDGKYNDSPITTLNYKVDSSIKNVDRFPEVKNMTALTAVELNEKTSYNKNINKFFKSNKLLNSAKINIDNATDFSEAFMELNNLNDIDVSGTDFKSVKNMASMFNACSNLSSVKGLNNINADKVVDTGYMFVLCESLTDLDMSNMSATSLIDANNMFNSCKNLSTLNISNWNTPMLRDMNNIFRDCSNLTNLNVSNVNTRLVEDMSEMFLNCSKLETLDLSSWTTSNTNDMYAMFKGCNALNEVNTLNWDVSNVTRFKEMFMGSGIREANLTSWVTNNLTDAGFMFKDSSVNAVDLSNWNTSNLQYIPQMFENCNNLRSVNLSNWDLTNVKNMDNIFNGCSNIDDINLSNVKMPGNYNIGSIITADMYNTITKADFTGWDISAAFDEGGIKTWVSKFARPNVSKFVLTNTSIGNSTDLSLLFINRSDLETIGDISSWNTANVTNMTSMFNNCSKLNNIGNISNWNVSKVVDTGYMFVLCESLTDLDMSNMSATSLIDANNMFNSCKNLSTLNISNWNTPMLRDMNNIFRDCSNLTNLNVSNVNTNSVEDMSEMFLNCSKLETLDLSSWTTSNTNDMYAMFKGCNALNEVNGISEFNTTNVTRFKEMFMGTNIQTANLSSWVTNNLTDAGFMFKDSSVNAVDLSNWNTSNLQYIPQMFENCNNLRSVNLSNWDLTNVKNMDNIFNGCSNIDELNIGNVKLPTNKTPYDIITPEMSNSIAKLNIANWDMSEFNVNTYEEFKSFIDKFGKLTDIDLSNIVLNPSMTDFNSLFINKDKLNSIKDLSTWDVTNVTNMSSMFNGCSKLTDIGNISNWNVSKVVDTGYMFNSCNFNTLNLSGWKFTLNVDLNNMFNGCSNLINVDLSNWETPVVVDMDHMFLNCSKLESVVTTGWTLSQTVKGLNHMFQNCSKLNSIDVSNWNVSGANDMMCMFDNCSAIPSLDVSTWITTSVENTETMFRNCLALTTLDLSNWDVSKVTNMTGMFEGCSNLKSVGNINSWTTTSLIYLDRMFKDTKIEELDLSNWDVSKVTNMISVFENCLDLTTLNLTGWTISDNVNITGIFDNTPNLASLICDDPKLIAEYNRTHAVVIFKNSDNNGTDKRIAVSVNTTIGEAIAKSNIIELENYLLDYMALTDSPDTIVNSETTDIVTNGLSIDCYWNIKKVNVTFTNIDNAGGSKIITVDRKTTVGSAITSAGITPIPDLFVTYNMNGIVVTPDTLDEILVDSIIECTWNTKGNLDVEITT